MDIGMDFQDDLEELNYYEQQKAEFEEWKLTDDYVQYVNNLIQEVLHGNEIL